MIDWSHYRTPRAMYQTKWGAYSKFHTVRTRDRAAWVAALILAAIVGVMFAVSV